MGYVSRKYLREKYNKLKNDMEDCLQVLSEEDLPDNVAEDAHRCKYNIIDMCQSIINEVNNA